MVRDEVWGGESRRWNGWARVWLVAWISGAVLSMAPHGPHRMFVGNQLRDTCQGAFSGIEPNPGVGALKSAGSWLAMGAELPFRLRRHQNARSSRFLSPFAASSVGYSSIFRRQLLGPVPGRTKSLERVRGVPPGSVSRRRENQRAIDFRSACRTRCLNCDTHSPPLTTFVGNPTLGLTILRSTRSGQVYLSPSPPTTNFPPRTPLFSRVPIQWVL